MGLSLRYKKKYYKKDHIVLAHVRTHEKLDKVIKDWTKSVRIETYCADLKPKIRFLSSLKKSVRKIQILMVL